MGHLNAKTRRPDSLETLELHLQEKYNAHPRVINEIHERIGIPPNIKMWRQCLAWLWADLTGHNKLKNYLGALYHINFKHTKSKLSKAIKIRDNILTLGLINIPKNIPKIGRRIRDIFAAAENETDLSDNAKALLAEMRRYANNNPTLSNLIEYLITKGFDRRDLEDFTSRIEADKLSASASDKDLLDEYKKWMIFAIYALEKGDTELTRYCKSQAERKFPTRFKADWGLISKRSKGFLGLAGLGRLSGRLAKHLAKVFQKKNVLTSGNIDSDLPDSNSETNKEARNVLAGLKWDSTTGKLADGETVDLVLPVYVAGIAGGVMGIPPGSAFSGLDLEELKVKKDKIFRPELSDLLKSATISGVDEHDGMNFKHFGSSTKMSSEFKDADDFFTKLKNKDNSFVADLSDPYHAFQSDPAKNTRTGANIGDSPKAFRVMDMSDVMLTKLATRKKKRLSKLLSTDAHTIGVTTVEAMPAKPVYVANDMTPMKTAIRSVGDYIGGKLDDIMIGLGSMVLSAPMGVGAMSSPYLLSMGVVNNALGAVATGLETAINSTIDTITANTGARLTAPRFATGGGTSAITGDAAGSNIFAHGAKPELVRSTGDMEVVPLNKTGTERRQKVTRMTDSERRSAMAVAVSSHAVRYRYRLPEGAEEVSNEGEAIKVFNVKPGLTDTVTVQGTETTLVELLGNIYAQLVAISGIGGTNSQLLTTIASNTASAKAAGSAGESANPFAGGFPTNLDTILGGE